LAKTAEYKELPMNETETLQHDDRIQHAEKGLGTIVTAPEREDVDVQVEGSTDIGAHSVFVKWDDDRLPVEAVPRSQLEKVPDAAAAISTGF
jgi:hypothetical protein